MTDLVALLVCSAAIWGIWNVDGTLKENSSIIFFPNEPHQNFSLSVRQEEELHTASSEDKDFKEFEKRVNSLANLDDFATFFSVTPPADGSLTSNITITSRLGGFAGMALIISYEGGLPGELQFHLQEKHNNGITNHDSPTTIFADVVSLDQAVCLPQATVVSLDLPEEPGISFFPVCVRVDRCGGCCFLDHHSCQPVESKRVMVKVVTVEEEVRKARRSRAKLTNLNYLPVEVEVHTACDCRCRLQQDDCNPLIHAYNEFQCACVCRNKNDELNCMSSRDHYWNNDVCGCFCRTEISCSTGQEFHHASCSCVSLLN